MTTGTHRRVTHEVIHAHRSSSPHHSGCSARAVGARRFFVDGPAVNDDHAVHDLAVNDGAINVVSVNHVEA